jgi:hypothetical protein
VPVGWGADMIIGDREIENQRETTVGKAWKDEKDKENNFVE